MAENCLDIFGEDIVGLVTEYLDVKTVLSLQLAAGKSKKYTQRICNIFASASYVELEPISHCLASKNAFQNFHSINILHICLPVKVQHEDMLNKIKIIENLRAALANTQWHCIKSIKLLFNNNGVFEFDDPFSLSVNLRHKMDLANKQLLAVFHSTNTGQFSHLVELGLDIMLTDPESYLHIVRSINRSCPNIRSLDILSLLQSKEEIEDYLSEEIVWTALESIELCALMEKYCALLERDVGGEESADSDEEHEDCFVQAASKVARALTTHKFPALRQIEYHCYQADDIFVFFQQLMTHWAGSAGAAARRARRERRRETNEASTHNKNRPGLLVPLEFVGAQVSSLRIFQSVLRREGEIQLTQQWNELISACEDRHGSSSSDRESFSRFSPSNLQKCCLFPNLQLLQCNQWLSSAALMLMLSTNRSHLPNLNTAPPLTLQLSNDGSDDISFCHFLNHYYESSRWNIAAIQLLPRVYLPRGMTERQFFSDYAPNPLKALQPDENESSNSSADKSVYTFNETYMTPHAAAMANNKLRCSSHRAQSDCRYTNDGFYSEDRGSDRTGGRSRDISEVDKTLWACLQSERCPALSSLQVSLSFFALNLEEQWLHSEGKLDQLPHSVEALSSLFSALPSLHRLSIWLPEVLYRPNGTVDYGQAGVLGAVDRYGHTEALVQLLTCIGTCLDSTLTRSGSVLPVPAITWLEIEALSRPMYAHIRHSLTQLAADPLAALAAAGCRVTLVFDKTMRCDLNTLTAT